MNAGRIVRAVAPLWGTGARGFSSGRGSLIGSMSEIVEADRYYEERNVGEAAAYYEQSLSILPLYTRGNALYNLELEAVACRYGAGDSDWPSATPGGESSPACRPSLPACCRRPAGRAPSAARK